MKRNRAILIVLTAVFTMASGAEAFARGGNGQGTRLRDGSCVRNQNTTQTQTRQRLRDGSGAGKGKRAGQGQMNRQGGSSTNDSTTPPASNSSNATQ